MSSGYGLSWKAIDTITVKFSDDAKLDGKPAEGLVKQHSGEVDFRVLYGRRTEFTNVLYLGEEAPEDGPMERFAIENKALDLRWEGASIEEVKAQLREYLANAHSIEGKWEVFVHVKADGGFENGVGKASIDTDFYGVLTLPDGRQKHTRIKDGDIPDPWDGSWTPPSGYREARYLQTDLPDCAKTTKKNYGRGYYHDAPEVPKSEEELTVWLKATPETVATIREMQKRLGDFGKMVEAALRPSNVEQTLKQVREGKSLLLGSGA